MDEEDPGRSTPPILLTFDREEPANPVVGVIGPDSPYLKTLSGLLKILQMVFSLGFFICLLSAPGLSSPALSTCFCMVALGGFYCSITLLGCYLRNVDQKYPHFPWFKTEFVSCWIFVLCHFAMAVIVIFQSVQNDKPLLILGACFCLGAMVVYGANAWHTYREYRMEEHRRSRRNRTISSIGVTYQPICLPRY